MHGNKIKIDISEKYLESLREGIARVMRRLKYDELIPPLRQHYNELVENMKRELYELNEMNFNQKINVKKQQCKPQPF